MALLMCSLCAIGGMLAGGICVAWWASREMADAVANEVRAADTILTLSDKLRQTEAHNRYLEALMEHRVGDGAR